MNYPYQYIFDSEITEESVKSLIDDTYHHEEVVVHLSTEGGVTRYMNTLVEYFNSRLDSLTLILTGELSSAGSFLLLDYQGIFRYSPTFIGGDIHKGWLNKHTNFQTESELFNHEMLNRINKERLDRYKELGLSEEQEKDYLDGKDVFINREQYIKWIEKHNQGKTEQ